MLSPHSMPRRWLWLLPLVVAACASEGTPTEQQPQRLGDGTSAQRASSSVDTPRSPSFAAQPAVLIPSLSQTIPARRSGFVSFQIESGDEVGLHDPLFSIEMPDDEDRRTLARSEISVAAEQLAAARTRHEKLKRNAADLSRISEHVAGEVVRNAAFDASIEKGLARVIEAQHRARELELSSLTQGIADGKGQAPFAGIVAHVEVDPGSWVSQGQPIVRIESKAARRLRFAVPPHAKHQFEVGRTIHWGLGRDEQDQEASVVWMAPRPDPITGLYFVEAQVAQTQSAIGSTLWVAPTRSHEGNREP